MLGLKLNHVSKRGPRSHSAKALAMPYQASMDKWALLWFRLVTMTLTLLLYVDWSRNPISISPKLMWYWTDFKFLLRYVVHYNEYLAIGDPLIYVWLGREYLESHCVSIKISPYKSAYLSRNHNTLSTIDSLSISTFWFEFHLAVKWINKNEKLTLWLIITSIHFAYE